jgi:GTPase SAR1 family protein
VTRAKAVSFIQVSIDSINEASLTASFKSRTGIVCTFCGGFGHDIAFCDSVARIKSIAKTHGLLPEVNSCFKQIFKKVKMQERFAAREAEAKKVNVPDIDLSAHSEEIRKLVKSVQDKY